jgi:hypothetical protein
MYAAAVVIISSDHDVPKAANKSKQNVPRVGIKPGHDGPRSEHHIVLGTTHDLDHDVP